ncbi:hypothetical protein Tco_1464915 [Tanacetum coccineum]
MDSDKYLEGKSMQRPPLFKSDYFIYWRNRIESYVKAKDIDLWHIIMNGNSQVKDNNIDLLVQQYEQFTILEEESIDSGFARFNTIITSLKALDEAKKESSDDETLTFGSDDKEFTMAPPRNKDQREFVGDAWSDSENEAEEKTNKETCLIAQSSNKVCLRIGLEPDEWIKDSGCSKHMTGNKNLFSTYKAYDGGNLVFGSNLKGKIIGKGCSIVAIRMDHGQEFDNEIHIRAFYDEQGIAHNFSAPRTP